MSIRPLKDAYFLWPANFSLAPGQIAQPLPREGHVIDEVGGNLNPAPLTTLHLTPALSPSLREAEREREVPPRLFTASIVERVIDSLQ
jgi:hypothetical protein